MAQRTGFDSYTSSYDSSYDRIEDGLEQDTSAFEQETSRPESTSYFSDQQYARRRAMSEERLPLFLSRPGDDPQPPDVERTSYKGVAASPVFKISLIGVALAAIAFGLLAAETPLTLFADAKASLPSTPDIVSAAPSTAPRADAGIQIVAKSSAPASIVPAPVATPTREEMVAAFRAAQQGQPESPPPAAATPVVRRLEPDEMAALLKRAKSLIAVGDIAPARLLLERAADAQEPSAALLLAQTYDPAVLGTPDSRSIVPDPAKARNWYQKAAQFGSPDAQQRLAQLGN